MKSSQFEKLIYPHANSLRASALNFTNNVEDANDLLQETMIKAFRYYEKFEKGTNLRSWLFVIMRNTFINNYRKDSRARSVVSNEEDLSSSSLMISSTRNGAETSFAMRDINLALAKLPKSCSVPFTRYVEGYKYEEIADELRIPVGTVKTRIHQARLLLKKQLQMYRERYN